MSKHRPPGRNAPTSSVDAPEFLLLLTGVHGGTEEGENFGKIKLVLHRVKRLDHINFINFRFEIFFFKKKVRVAARQPFSKF